VGSSPKPGPRLSDRGALSLIWTARASNQAEDIFSAVAVGCESRLLLDDTLLVTTFVALGLGYKPIMNATARS
jgi:hypothetical protein